MSGQASQESMERGFWARHPRVAVAAIVAVVIGILSFAALAVSAFLLTRSPNAKPSAATRPQRTMASTPTAFGLPVECLDPGQPGLISCEQALSVALKSNASPSVPESTEVRLSTYQPQEGGGPLPVWVVSFHGVPIRLDTAEGGCIVGDWNVYVAARTGSYMFAGHKPPATPCP